MKPNQGQISTFYFLFSMFRERLRLLFLFLVSILVLIPCGCSSRDRQPVAAQGCVDLSHWDFAQNGSVSLNGEWEFYWGRLLTPSDFRGTTPEKTGYLNLPGTWKGYPVQGRPLSGEGHATLRLTVDIPPAGTSKSIRIRDIGSVCKIWANGRLLAASGQVGTSLSEEIPHRHQIISKEIPAGDASLEIILQLSNYHWPNVGLRSAMQLGNAERIRLDSQRVRATAALFGGMLLVIGLYHLPLYLLRRAALANLYFSIGCLAWSSYILFGNIGDWLMASLLPSLPWSLSIDVEAASLAIGSTFLVMIYHAQFRHTQSVIFERAFQVLGGMFVICVIALPTRLYLSILSIYYLVILLLILYLLFRIIIDLVRREPGASFLIPGYALAVLFGLNELSYEFGLVNTAFMFHYGLLALILSHSFLISYRSSRAHLAVERLSHEMKLKNIALTKVDKIKDEFLANTSHELKTPLNGIIGMTDALINGAAGKLAGHATANLKMISASGRRLANLINDILDFSRLKNRDISLNLTPVDIRSLADTVVIITSQLVVGKKVPLKNEIPEDLPAVWGDEDRLQQVLYNLIGNAIKYTSNGEILISASEKDAMVKISVSDTGIGIPPEKQQTIFQPFEQADASVSRSFGGAGLGLGISRHLIELHHGELFLESSSEKGSTFCFTLQKSSQIPEISVHRAHDAETVSSAVPLMMPDDEIEDYVREEAPALPGQPRILIVDDDPINLMVAVNALATEKMSVTTANSGRETIERFNAGERYDLVLLDIMMPEVSGLEVCKWLRERYPAVALPVILVTAKNRLSDLVEGLACGASDYITKPFAGQELCARVQTHLEIKSAHEMVIENQRLKDEIKLREETERDLRLTQRRLSGALDTIDDALLSINESAEICFCNKIFENAFGHSADTLLGSPITPLLAGSSRALIDTWVSRMPQTEDPFPENENPEDLVIRKKDGTEIKTSVFKAVLQLDDEYLMVLIFKDNGVKPPDRIAGSAKAQYVIAALNRNRERLYALENSLSGLTPKRLAHNADFRNDLRAIDSALARLGKEIVAGESSEAKRSLAVNMMNQVVDAWCSATGSGKIDFARASGLWTVYANRDGHERSQTLDRYLDLDTFPNRPRWRQIFRSVEFVLESCDLNAVHRERLESLVAKLR